MGPTSLGHLAENDTVTDEPEPAETTRRALADAKNLVTPYGR
jgi:hypothetical protein